MFHPAPWVVYGHAAEEKAELLLVPGTVTPRLSALGGHRYTAAGMHAWSQICICFSPKLTPVLEAFSFVIGWIWVFVMVDENAAQHTYCFISLLKNDLTEQLQAMEVSALPLLHKKNVDSPVASFGLPVTASITTHSNIILAWIHVLSCDSLFTGINQRECLIHHLLGISGIKKKKKLFFSTLDCVSFSSWIFFLQYKQKLVSCTAFWRVGVFFASVI